MPWASKSGPLGRRSPVNSTCGEVAQDRVSSGVGAPIEYPSRAQNTLPKGLLRNSREGLATGKGRARGGSQSLRGRVSALLKGQNLSVSIKITIPSRELTTWTCFSLS